MISKHKKLILTLILILLISSLGIFILGIGKAEAIWPFDKILNIDPYAIVTGIIAAIGVAMRSLALLLFWLVSMIFEMALGFDSFTDAGVVQMGWKITRDLANMFFVLILLTIAFATILRIETYGMKTLLPKLIIVALLINFSLVFCGVIIDFTQILTHFFYDQVSEATGISAQIAGVLEMPKLSKMNPDASAAEQLAAGTGGIFMMIFSVFFGIALTLAASLAIGIGAFFLIVRLIALWILLILAPIAWFLGILPATANLFKQWWNTFLKWAFFAPIYMFFVYLAIKAADAGSFTSIVQVEMQNIVNASGFKETLWSTLTSSPVLLLQFLAILGLLFGGLIAAQKMGVYGAQGAMGMAKFFGKGAAGIASRNLARIPMPAAGRMGKRISKFGERLTKGGYKKLGARLQTGGDILAETKGKGIFSPGAWKRAWPARRAEVEARAYARPTGSIRDQLNYVLSLGKERTRFGDQAEQAEVNRRKQEIGDTSRASEFLVDGLEKSMAAGNKIDTSAYLRLIFEGNEQNEFIKQSKILGSEEVLGKDEKGKSLAHVVSDETVTKAVYAALKEAGFADEQQAKIAMDLGNQAFASGNYANYGMGMYDMDAKQFVKPDIESQRKAAAGKSINLEPQTKDRNWHWNSIMKEDKSGNPIELHGGGKALLEKITAGDIEQLNRTRPDFVKKVGSEQGVSDIKGFADTLEATDSIQASLIKKFAAQLHVLRTGQRPPDWYDENKYGALKGASPKGGGTEKQTEEPSIVPPSQETFKGVRSEHPPGTFG